MLENIVVAYFSPTGGTRQAALLLAKHLAHNVHEIDLSLPQIVRYTFTENDILIVAAPVFGGRIPRYFCSKLNSCVGQQARVISAVVYGNRAYEDALLELNDCLHAQDFRVFASVALLAEHSMVPTIAQGRPDAQDEVQIADFAKAIMEKLIYKKTSDDFVVPGNNPYKEWQQMPLVPSVDSSCIFCGICAEKCPTAAIPKDDVQTTEQKKCILCMRCISICPTKARKLPEQAQTMINKKLEAIKGIRKENELFL